jgi:hypothetical protein
MRRLVRVILVAFTSATLAGCGSTSGWDGVNSLSDSVSDMMADFNPLGANKKPLPGDRRAVFPEGVPGVQQGVPAEMVRRNEPPVPPPLAGPQTAAVPEPEEEATPAPAPPRQQKATKTVRRARSTTAIEPQRSTPADDEVWPPLPKQ